MKPARDGDHLKRHTAGLSVPQGESALAPEGILVALLLDLKMPRLGGVQVLRQLKSDEQVHSVPILILTFSRESRDLECAWGLGAKAFVVKPVRFVDFVEAIKRTGEF
jgi:two-component system response regulator